MTKDDISRRKVNLAHDGDAILEFHCRINYESETPYARQVSYDEYREKWMSSSQPGSFLSSFAQTREDDRTIAEVWEAGGNIVGYLWMRFTDLPDYDLTVAELMDLGVAPEYQRRGIGLKMIKRAEEHARKMGAALLRSDTGIENLASQRLHEKVAFRPYRICYEKVLRYKKPAEEIPMEAFTDAFNDAQELLRDCGYSFDVSVRELRDYTRTDTFYPSAIPWSEILRNRLMVAHEVVEIAQLKQMALRITQDVVVRNIEQVYRAHLKATQVELEIAAAMGAYDHIQDRLRVLEDWTGDPLVPMSLREDYENLPVRAKQLVAGRDSSILPDIGLGRGR
jgi:GNAT superfamily N-acetyltransferase